VEDAVSGALLYEFAGAYHAIYVACAETLRSRALPSLRGGQFHG
jgi:hypothetical protein